MSELQEKQILEQVDPARLMRHVEFLSEHDRESGSPGERVAAEYFERQMREIGLEPSVTYIKNLISLPVRADLIHEQKSYPCIPQSYAVSTPPQGLEAECAVIGDSATDLRGKIGIARGLASPLACYRLERMGACGLIFINGGDYPHNMSISPVWGMPLPEDLEKLGKIPVVSVDKNAGEALLAAVRGGSSRVRMFAEVDTSFKQVPLCVADLKAETPTDKYLLFNGHVDSWHKGATDNGTSNAAILEIARILKNRTQDLRVNIRFVWWSGHSNGRYSGSNWYADYHWEDIHNNAVMNINIDAIGSVGSTAYPTVDASSQCFAVGRNAVSDLTGQLPKYKRIARNGDQSFWGHGVPSLFQVLSLQPPEAQGKDTFVPGLPWFWHTTEDLCRYVDADVLALDCRIYLLAIWRIATAAAVPFEFAALGREMAGDLADYQNASGLVDLSELIRRTEELGAEFEALDRRIEAANREKDFGEGRKLLDLSMDVNRTIMPVYYCVSSPYQADDALPSCPFPGLRDIRIVGRIDDELLREGYIRKIKRETNRIAHALSRCLELLKASGASEKAGAR